MHLLVVYSSFGNGDLFVEEYIENARHIEIQLICDEKGGFHHAYERDCSLQVRNQKVLEVAPARDICPELRETLTGAAIRLAKGSGYANAGTVEFLVQGELSDPKARYIFLEINPRIQVEHTITEEITGLDLIELQLKIGVRGEALKDLLPGGKMPPLKGAAFQLRVTLLPGKYEKKFVKYVEPKGVRVDTGVREGGPIVPSYDSMICKLIVKGSDFADTVKKSKAAVDAFVIEGCPVNKANLQQILDAPAFNEGRVTTTFLQSDEFLKGTKKGGAAKREKAAPKVLRTEKIEVPSPIPGQVVELPVKAGDTVEAGQTVMVVSAMKMLNEIPAPHPGKILEVCAKLDASINDGDILVKMEANIMESVEDSPSSAQTKARRGPADDAASNPGVGFGRQPH